MPSAATDAEQVVDDFFAAMGGGNFDRAREILHPDAAWKVMVTGVPGEGVHRGPDAIFAFITPIRALFEPGDPRVELRAKAANGPLVILEMEGTGRFRDGRPYRNNYVMAIEVRDGRIVELREYMDSYYVHQLALG
ncbi:nuclear transport factor 2 family protein [Sphingomonas sp. MMS24-J13]|uniref:nuclear transport factor 2 family protein n=1 Tax=Sphingomonas sp. MMS24-J13 TaxID=3238686 RepID=UPI00384B7A18